MNTPFDHIENGPHYGITCINTLVPVNDHIHTGEIFGYDLKASFFNFIRSYMFNVHVWQPEPIASISLMLSS